MSTFTGDATITDVISASASRSTPETAGTTVAYTVPAGRFAEVWLVSANIGVNGISSGGGDCWIGSYAIADVPNGTPAPASDSKSWEDAGVPFLINEGETVRVTFQNTSSNQNASIDVRIKEYNKP